MKSILYISRSRMPADEAPELIEEMLESARVHNRSVQITGALIFTGERFAQLIEGPEAAVDRLMSNVLLDSRHDRVKILSAQPCAARRFQGWDMAYSGLSSYVDRHIRPLFQDLSDAEQSQGHDALIELMFAFSVSSGFGPRPSG